MRYIDGGLQAPYVIEARLKAFEDFVRSKAVGGYPGTIGHDAALCNYGFDDYFGPVRYEHGWHDGLWILPAGGDNEKVLIFRSRAEAQGYGKQLQPILQRCGYMRSKVDVHQVAVHSTFRTGFFGSLANSETWDDKDCYILRIKVRK